jgi:hypothetical protein
MHAHARFFQKGKPRNRQFRGPLVMGKKAKSRAVKQSAQLCPVVTFQ